MILLSMYLGMGFTAIIATFYMHWYQGSLYKFRPWKWSDTSIMLFWIIAWPLIPVMNYVDSYHTVTWDVHP